MSKRRQKGRARSVLMRKARKGFRGHPIATVAYYGPDDQFASKVAVGIIPHEGGDVAALERWYSEGVDVRYDPTINQEVVEFIDGHEVRSVFVTDGPIGCPHEEGIDYPEGESCPECPYWAGRDRWTGELLDEGISQALRPAAVVGCAWYRAGQWERLHEIAADSEKLEHTYEEWVDNAERALRGMRESGMGVEKVEVDVEELLAWCQRRGLEVDARARAHYAAEELRRRHQGSDDDQGA
ncbi:MAG: hypothetical protein U9R72_14970 [Chloroflexota bacterium]|nr:hypothetical protein [Chloroflexota bacterium]